MNGAFHQVPGFHPLDAIPPVVIACIYILASSLLREPSRRNFNAIMIGGAGAAYLSGGFGVWEFVFCAVVTFCAYKGLQSYRFIGIGWLLHSAWDVLHHLSGNPIVPATAAIISAAPGSILPPSHSPVTTPSGWACQLPTGAREREQAAACPFN